MVSAYAASTGGEGGLCHRRGEGLCKCVYVCARALVRVLSHHWQLPQIKTLAPAGSSYIGARLPTGGAG